MKLTLLHEVEPGKRAALFFFHTVQMIAFWLAVVLPLIHVGYILTGFDTVHETALLFGLFGLNILALVVGHGYKQP